MDFSRFIFLSFAIFILLHPFISNAQQPNYRFHFCENVNYTSKSSFPENRNITLASLVANANKSGVFYNMTTGVAPDRAYGLFLCRGDISPELCQLSVRTASEDVITRCPMRKEAIIWYDECMVRYANQSIFSQSQESPKAWLWNQNNISSSPEILFNLGRLMDDLERRASSSKRMFAIGETQTTSFSKIYGMVQCTPDISVNDCTICLQNAINDIPRFLDVWQGGRVLKPSCNIRFEKYLFYTPSAETPSPPLPQSIPVAPTPSGKFMPTNTFLNNLDEGEGGLSKGAIIAIVVPIVVTVVLVSILFFCKKAKKRYPALLEEIENDIETVQSLQFDLATIEAATKNFLEDNKIGAGGFGVVYKGILSNGQKVAVKRLSSDSGQGAEEFKNEVIVVAKLQHRNLVRLLGFCLERGEKILVFEFVPNRSMDYFLFDNEKQGQLDWQRRYKIIGGIARGILYLHEDSRLKIIHRDLKASNILLDEDMNPKISDFGMAKIFGVDQTQGNSSRIVGTYGYISPEYAMHGHFSVKSDVYSFGVLILEIISGKKNSSFYQSDQGEDLQSYAWKVWRDGTPLEFMDPTLSSSYSRAEVIRCIHIGLLCVQEDATDRPNMTTLVLMLGRHSVSLPLPKRPAFYPDSNMPLSEIEKTRSKSKSKASSTNAISNTELYPR